MSNTKKTPAAIIEAARKLGFNACNFCGTIGGEQYYNIGMVDENGLPLPTGTPAFLVVGRDGAPRLVDGEEGWEAYRSLFPE